MKRKYNTNEIVEAGLITGIMVVLMLITGYVPVINIVSTLLLPLPITVLALRRGYNVAILSVVISTVIVSMVYDPITAVQGAVSFGLLGISLAYCINNDKSFGETVIILTFATFFASIINATIYAQLILKDGIRGIYNEADRTIKMFKDSFETMKTTVYKNNINENSMKQFDEALKLFTPDYLLKIFFGGLFGYSLVTSYINYLVAEKVLKKLKYNIKEPILFRNISFSSKVGIVIVTIMLSGSILIKGNIPLGEYLYNSAYYALMFILQIQGISVVSWLLLSKLNLPKAGAIAIIVFGFTIIIPFSIYIGLADLILDFRKLSGRSLFSRREK